MFYYVFMAHSQQENCQKNAHNYASVDAVGDTTKVVMIMVFGVVSITWSSVDPDFVETLCPNTPMS